MKTKGTLTRSGLKVIPVEKPKREIPEKPGNDPILSEENPKEKIKKFIRAYTNHYHKMPTMEWLGKKVNMTPYQIQSFLRELTDEGFLKKNTSRYHLNKNQPEKKEEPEPERIIEKTKEKIREFRRMPISLIIFKIIFIIVGSGAVYLSFYHTKIWFETLYNPVRASIASGSMVLFSTAGIDTVLILFQYRYYLLSIVFGLAALVVVFFSMFSTVAGQYRFLVEKITTGIEADKTGESVLWLSSEYKSELDKLDKEIERIEKDISGFSSQLSELRMEDFKTAEEYESAYWTTNYGKKEAEKRLSESKRERAGVKEELDTLIKNNPDVDFSGVLKRKLPPDLYTWLASVSKKITRTEPIQFWSFAFPAIFYDIMAPLSFFFAFFINGEKKRRREK